MYATADMLLTSPQPQAAEQAQETAVEVVLVRAVLDGDRESFFRAILSDHVVVQVLLDVDRARHFESRFRRLFTLTLFGDDVVTEFDALVADIHARTSDEFFDFVLALAAEAAAEKTRRRFFSVHIVTHLACITFTELYDVID